MLLITTLILTLCRYKQTTHTTAFNRLIACACVGGQRESGCFIDLTELRSLHKHTLSELSSQQISKPSQSDCTVLDSPDSCEFSEGCFSQETYEENVSRVCLCKTKPIFTFNDPTEAFKYMIISCVEMP